MPSRHPLRRKDFGVSTLELAKELLGLWLEHRTKLGTTVGRIVETEAYLQDDPASHSYRGESSRNSPMFGPPGHSYIYFIYGMYHCFNVVSGISGIGEAVLIRALEPISGLDLMRRRRPGVTDRELCRGPAKLFIAMGLNQEMNGSPLYRGDLRILAPSTPKMHDGEQIGRGPRIGISKGKKHPYRFYLKHNHFVSR